tara:strand:+ start:355 stop:483 length:129 start_codon:yes stop_codon:yes gene_type:complete
MMGCPLWNRVHVGFVFVFRAEYIVEGDIAYTDEQISIKQGLL